VLGGISVQALFAAIIFFFLTIHAGAAERRVALVVGNSTYAKAEISLANPKNDAADIASTLREIGFEVTEAPDLAVLAFDKALLEFTAKAHEADIALFFYAGHGLQISGRSFLMPTDAKLENEASALRELMAIQDIVAKVENAAKVSIIVIDACRDNPLADKLKRRVRAENRSVNVAEGLGPLSVIGSNTLVVYATVPGEVAQDGAGRNSPFMASLLKHVKTAGLEVELMFKRVTADVLKTTKGKQQPERLSRLQTVVFFLAAHADAPPKSKQQPTTPLAYENESQRLMRSFAGHTNSVSSVAISPDGHFALSGSSDNTLKLWDVATGKELHSFEGHSGKVSSVAFSPNGRFALSGSWDKTLKLWDAGTAKPLHSFAGHSGWVTSVAFSPDGRFALSGSQDELLKLWDIRTGKELRKFVGNWSTVESVAFSPDGSLVLSAGGDGILWQVSTGKNLRAITSHLTLVFATAFSPNGRFALTGGEMVKLWDTDTGKELRSFTGYSGLIRSVAFSPDGRFALSGSGDGTLKLWEVGTGSELRSFAGHSGRVNSVAFSPDGRFVLSGGDDKTLKLWDAGAVD
jgi:WD40 repeat protein